MVSILQRVRRDISPMVKSAIPVAMAVFPNM
jgi:hypothetical protein